jgi:hypothetical protein
MTPATPTLHESALAKYIFTRSLRYCLLPAYFSLQIRNLENYKRLNLHIAWPEPVAHASTQKQCCHFSRYKLVTYHFGFATCRANAQFMLSSEYIRLSGYASNGKEWSSKGSRDRRIRAGPRLSWANFCRSCSSSSGIMKTGKSIVDPGRWKHDNSRMSL